MLERIWSKRNTLPSKNCALFQLKQIRKLKVFTESILGLTLPKEHCSEGQMLKTESPCSFQITNPAVMLLCDNKMKFMSLRKEIHP